MSNTSLLSSAVDLIRLRKQLVDSFNVSELETLCFDLGIRYEDVPGDTLTAKTRELVKYCYRYGRLQDLVQYARRERPNVAWGEPASFQVIDRLPEEWGDPLERLYVLVRALNENRRLPFSHERTRRGDDIAFAMREAAPLLFGQLDVKRWLNSRNRGKRLAAIKYLDWLQDIEFFGTLLIKLTTESPFMQLHVLITLASMIDQLDQPRQMLLRARLGVYNIFRNDKDCEFWKQRILEKLVM